MRRFQSRYTAQEATGETHLTWALRYGLFKAIQIVIDGSCQLVTRDGLGVPQSYRECIQLLQEHDYLSPGLASRVPAMVGLRNMLVHEYVEVDVQQLFSLLDQLEDLEAFLDAVTPRFARSAG